MLVVMSFRVTMVIVLMSVLMAIGMAVEGMAAVMGMDMAVALLACASEKTAYLVRGKIWYYLHPFLKLERNVIYVMCLHYRPHYLLVDC